ncbi:MAG: choice-of-anchor Q domain-containing protein, partial [Chloroflexota bacterium]
AGVHEIKLVHTAGSNVDIDGLNVGSSNITVLQVTATPTSLPKAAAATATQSLPSSFYTTYYSTQSGSSGGQSVSVMSVQDQSGTKDTSADYVSFTTPNIVYQGLHLYQLPGSVSSLPLKSITVKANYKGPAYGTQKWTWSIYDVGTWTWVPIGTNSGVTANTWKLLTFQVSAAGQYVNATGNILLRLESNNASGDAKIDYETIQLTYGSAIVVPTVIPTYTNTAAPTQTLIPLVSATSTQVPTIQASPTRTPTSTSVPTSIATATYTPSATIPPTVVNTSTPTQTVVSNTPTATIPASSSIYYVSTSGSDSNNGSQSAPWKTITKAANSMASGTTVTVLAGNYPEFISNGKSGLGYIASGTVTMNGFYLTGNNNKVKGFTITNPASDFGIRITGDNNVVQFNDISNTKQDGIWFFGSGNTFTANYIHDIVDRSLITTDPHVDCFQTWGPAENIVFDKNICDHTNTYGSNQITQISNINQPVNNITLKNNVFIMHDPGYSPMTFYHMDGLDPITNMNVINNTFVHVNGTGSPAIWFRNITGAYAINNLFIDYGEAAATYILTDSSTGVQISNNAVYKSDGVRPLGGMLSNDIWVTDPGLMNLAGYNFHLKSTSVLINKGTNAGSWNADDFDGIARPQSGVFDIGAFEFKP